MNNSRKLLTSLISNNLTSTRLSPIKHTNNNRKYMFGIPQLNTTLNQSSLFTTSSRNKSLTFLRSPPNISTEINESISRTQSKSPSKIKKRLFNQVSNSNSNSNSKSKSKSKSSIKKNPKKKGKSSPKK
jgi:hypothetical protein